MTTVGYGDISPQTNLGQALAGIVMIMGYRIIIVPIGIFTAVMASTQRMEVRTQACPNCSREGHDFDANFCKYRGTRL